MERNSLMRLPDKTGHFGIYGGRYVSETLMPALLELEEAYYKYRNDSSFKKEFAYYLKYYVGRETPLFFAERFSKLLGGSRIYLKREDLNHTGAHKINNTIGQILLAKRMGKTRIIAETGAGQHGVASAAAADGSLVVATAGGAGLAPARWRLGFELAGGLVLGWLLPGCGG